MLSYILESDEDYLFSEEAVTFMMESAPPKVKKSFVKRLTESIQRMITKVSDGISKLMDRIRGKKLQEAVRKNPKIGNEKVKTKKYDQAIDAGLKAVDDIEKTSTAKEAKEIAKKYHSKRNKILAATAVVTIGAVVGVVAHKMASRKKQVQDLKHNVDETSDAVEEIVEDLSKVQEKKKTLDDEYKDTMDALANFNDAAKEAKAKFKELGFTGKPKPKMELKGANSTTKNQDSGAILKDKLEKAITKMQTEERVLKDMSEEEKETVYIINRISQLNKQEQRAKDVAKRLSNAYKYDIKHYDRYRAYSDAADNYEATFGTTTGKTGKNKEIRKLHKKLSKSDENITWEDIKRMTSIKR